MAAKYQAYSEYKDSGDEWLSEIPARWLSLSLGKVVEFMNNGSSATQIEESEGTVKVTRIETISAGVINQEKIGYVGRHDILSRFLLQKGDIQFSNINSLSMVGNCAIFDAEQELFAGMNLLHIRPDISRVFSKYMLYQFKTKWFRNRVEASAKPAINQASIPTGTLKNFDFLCPSLEEQEQIANFLDHETAKIDTLIEKQQQLIKLLKEKRQAVISHAVTKGLNPSAPMRDSGVEWLGEVPEHWEAVSIKRLFQQVKRQDFPQLEVLSVYRDYGVVKKSSRDDNNNKTPENLTMYQLVEVGDLVVNKMKAWQGSMGISGYEGITSPDYIVYKSLHNEEDKFLHFLLRSQMMPDVYRSISNGIRPSQWRLEPEKFEQLAIYFPKRSEQISIISHIEEHLEKYDALIESCNGAIELMQERRTALISAAVTGKIDVRHFNPEDGQVL